jgi:hypothetical protein
VKWNVLYKGDGLELTIYANYSWEIELNIGLDVSFGNMWGWRRLREERG